MKRTKINNLLLYNWGIRFLIINQIGTVYSHQKYYILLLIRKIKIFHSINSEYCNKNNKKIAN
jgi:hypothetical protein